MGLKLLTKLEHGEAVPRLWGKCFCQCILSPAVFEGIPQKIEELKDLVATKAEVEDLKTEMHAGFEALRKALTK